MAKAKYLQDQFGLDGKRAVVTGAGRGIGRAIAEALAAAGAEVCVHYNKSEAAAHEVVAGITKSGGKAWTAGGDLTKSDQVNALFEQVNQRWGGALDILVHNSGDLLKRSKIPEFPDQLLDDVMRLNFYSTVFAARAAIPMLRRGRDPIIITLSSIAAHNGGANGATVYAASKGAVHTFTRGLARELAPDIRVNGIAPGTALTDFHRTHSTPEMLEGTKNNTMLKRLGVAEDHGAAVVFLCAKGGSFITGEVIEINGGLWVA
jgi:3-oxoacyl-[acyl-carrier protein] reductase